MAESVKVLVSDSISERGVELLRERRFDVDYRPDLSASQLLGCIGQYDALLVRSKTQVTAEVLAAAARLKWIGRAGAGVDNIDLEEATRRGIIVANTPGGNSVSAAEHAMALLLALARKIPEASARTKSGAWDKKSFTGIELYGKTLGILGLGKIGAEVARRALSFEMRVIAYDPFVSAKLAQELRVELHPLAEVIRRSDFLSLHLPSNEDTERMINAGSIAEMKRGVCLVNCARGDLIDEQDLVAALDSGHVAAAGLDVFREEPTSNQALLSHPRVIATPHIAGSTVEAQERVGYDVAIQLADYFQDGVIRNAVNFPAISTAEYAELRPYLDLGLKLGCVVSQINRIRIDEIGIRYYGSLVDLNFKPISNYILSGILKPTVARINPINARSAAQERGIAIIETVSTRPRSFSNLISIQLRSADGQEWVEGALLHHQNMRLVSIDGIDLEVPLGKTMLFIRNNDKPGVIGQIGTILGNHAINIASFTLGRGDEDAPRRGAIGVVNTDNDIPTEVLREIQACPAIEFARVVRL